MFIRSAQLLQLVQFAWKDNFCNSKFRDWGEELRIFDISTTVTFLYNLLVILRIHQHYLESTIIKKKYYIYF